VRVGGQGVVDHRGRKHVLQAREAGHQAQQRVQQLEARHPEQLVGVQLAEALEGHAVGQRRQLEQRVGSQQAQLVAVARVAVGGRLQAAAARGLVGLALQAQQQEAVGGGVRVVGQATEQVVGASRVAQLRYPVPGATNTPYALLPWMVMGAAVALARLSYPPAAGPLNPPGGAWVSRLLRPVWS